MGNETVTAKICSCCGENKPISDFNKKSAAPDGVRSECRECSKIARKKYYDSDKACKYAYEYRKNNPEKVKASTEKWRRQNKKHCLEYKYKWESENKDKVRAYFKRYVELNKEAIASKNAIWKHSNPDKIRASVNKRRSAKLNATVGWANPYKIKEVFSLACLLEETYSTKYHVDHIIPLIHPLVCGLHVEGNLQVLTAKENLEKGNFFESGPHYPDLPIFDDARSQAYPAPSSDYPDTRYLPERQDA